MAETLLEWPTKKSAKRRRREKRHPPSAAVIEARDIGRISLEPAIAMLKMRLPADIVAARTGLHPDAVIVAGVLGGLERTRLRGLRCTSCDGRIVEVNDEARFDGRCRRCVRAAENPERHVPRMQRVAAMLAAGATRYEIARELRLSPAYAATYIREARLIVAHVGRQ